MGVNQAWVIAGFIPPPPLPIFFILENLMEFASSRLIDWCGSQNAAVMLKEALTTTNFIKENRKLINN